MEEKRKRGRPKKEPSIQWSPTVTTRLRRELYCKLKAEAAAGGFSLSETIERRLEQSYRQEDMADTLRRVLAERDGEPVRAVAYAFSFADGDLTQFDS